MSVDVTEYICVHQRAAELGCLYPENFAILPENFSNAPALTDLRQRSEAATVRTLFRLNQIPLSSLLPNGEQVPYIQNNSYDLVYPTLFVSSALISGNEALISLAISVIANYATDFFKGMSGAKTVTLDIIVEKSQDHMCKKVSYKGDVEGLKTLPDIIKKIAND